jgi:DNA modification methylase
MDTNFELLKTVGRGGIENYVAWMTERLIECRRVLKESGSMYLHTDWHASAYLKVEMDKIFGLTNFKNDIIWPRTYAHGDTKQGAKAFGHIHDIILFYTKSDESTWHQPYIPYEEEYASNVFKKEDKKGRKYQTVTLTASKPGGDTSFEWHGIRPPKGRFWAYSKANLDKMEKEGKIVFLKSGIPRLKKYLDESQGVAIQDVWTDIRRMSTFSNERLGYPTQKPIALLNRIVEASSNVTDVVLDPFCGCGTSIASSYSLGRRWVGIDVSPTACKLMAKRMRSLKAKVGEIGLPQTVSDLRKIQPFEFQNWVMEKLYARINPRLSGDMGIDGYYMDGTPIQVKQSDHVGRPTVDSFETAIERADKKKGIIVAFGFSRDAFEGVAEAKNNRGVEITLKSVEEILKET